MVHFCCLSLGTFLVSWVWKLDGIKSNLYRKSHESESQTTDYAFLNFAFGFGMNLSYFECKAGLISENWSPQLLLHF